MHENANVGHSLSHLTEALLILKSSYLCLFLSHEYHVLGFSSYLYVCNVEPVVRACKKVLAALCRWPRYRSLWRPCADRSCLLCQYCLIQPTVCTFEFLILYIKLMSMVHHLFSYFTVKCLCRRSECVICHASRRTYCGVIFHSHWFCWSVYFLFTFILARFI
jgi:hypothetical protein